MLNLGVDVSHFRGSVAWWPEKAALQRANMELARRGFCFKISGVSSVGSERFGSAVVILIALAMWERSLIG